MARNKGNENSANLTDFTLDEIPAQNAEETLDQPAVSQEVHGLGLNGFGTGGQYVDAVIAEGKNFQEALVQGERMAIADKNYISGLPLPLWEIPEFGTSEGRKALAHEFAEESLELEKCLLTLWNKGIETMACCSGHSARPRYEYDNSPYITLKLTERASVESLANLIADYNNEYGDAIDVSHISLSIDPTSKAFIVSFGDLYASEHRLDMSRREYDEQRNRFFAELNERFQSLELGSEEEQEMDQQEYIIEVAERVLERSKQSLIVSPARVSYEPALNVGCCVFDRQLNSQLLSTEVQAALKEMAIFNDGMEFKLDKETLQVKNNPSLLRYQKENFEHVFDSAQAQTEPLQSQDLQHATLQSQGGSSENGPEYVAGGYDGSYANDEYAPLDSVDAPEEDPRELGEGSEILRLENRNLPNNGVQYYYVPYKDEEDQSKYLRVMRKDGKLYINFDLEDQTLSGKTQITCQVLQAKENFGTNPGKICLDVLTPTGSGSQQQVVTLPIPILEEDSNSNTVIWSLNMLAQKNLEAIYLNDSEILAEIHPTTQPPENVENFSRNAVEARNATEVVEIEQVQDEVADTKTSAFSVKGQTLKDGVMNVGDQTYVYAAQEIEFAKNIGMKQAQKIAVLHPVDENESDLLISVSRGTETPLATFHKIEGRDDAVLMRIQPSLVSSLRSSNAALSIPEPLDVVDGYYEYEIKNLSFSQSGKIETGQVNGANEDFAINFSSLGVMCRDKNDAQGASRTSGSGLPLDIGISEQFLQLAIQNSGACQIERDEPLFSQVLVSLAQLHQKQPAIIQAMQEGKQLEEEYSPEDFIAREITLGNDGNFSAASATSGNADETQPLQSQIRIHSLPFTFFMPKSQRGNQLQRQEYLNVIQSVDKQGIKHTQLYMQLRQDNNRTNRPKPYELLGASVEFQEADRTYSLYLRLKDGTKSIDVVLKGLDLGFENHDPEIAPEDLRLSQTAESNIQSLVALKEIAPEAFEQASTNAKSTALERNQILRDQEGWGKNEPLALFDKLSEEAFEIFPTAANRTEMQINTFSVVGSLRIQELEQQQKITKFVQQDIAPTAQEVEQIADPPKDFGFSYADYEDEKITGADSEQTEEPYYEETSDIIDEPIYEPYGDEIIEGTSSEENENTDNREDLTDETSDTNGEGELTEEEEIEGQQWLEDPGSGAISPEDANRTTREISTGDSGEDEPDEDKSDKDELKLYNPKPPRPVERPYDGPPIELTREAEEHVDTPQVAGSTQPNSNKPKAEKKKKSLLKISKPKQGITNMLIGAGMLLLLAVAPFTAGVLGGIVIAGGLGLLLAAGLYGGLKIQNIVKSAINHSRTRYNDQIDQENIDELMAQLSRQKPEPDRAYLQERIDDRDALIDCVNSNPDLTPQQKQAKIAQIMKDYEPFATQLAAEDQKQLDKDIQALKGELEKAQAKRNAAITERDNLQKQFDDENKAPDEALRKESEKVAKLEMAHKTTALAEENVRSAEEGIERLSADIEEFEKTGNKSAAKPLKTQLKKEERDLESKKKLAEETKSEELEIFHQLVNKNIKDTEKALEKAHKEYNEHSQEFSNQKQKQQEQLVAKDNAAASAQANVVAIEEQIAQKQAKKIELQHAAAKEHPLERENPAERTAETAQERENPQAAKPQREVSQAAKPQRGRPQAAQPQPQRQSVPSAAPAPKTANGRTAKSQGQPTEEIGKDDYGRPLTRVVPPKTDAKNAQSQDKNANARQKADVEDLARQEADALAALKNQAPEADEEEQLRQELENYRNRRPARRVPAKEGPQDRENDGFVSFVLPEDSSPRQENPLTQNDLHRKNKSNTAGRSNDLGRGGK